MTKHSEEFKQESVRIALNSGLSRERLASDLGVGKSTLGKWIAQYRPTDLIPAPQADLARENERLRLENRVLKEERDILKNRRWAATRLCAVETPATLFFGGELPMAYWRHPTPLRDVAHGPMRT